MLGVIDSVPYNCNQMSYYGSHQTYLYTNAWEPNYNN